MASNPITLTGITNLTRNGQQELIHRTAITITDARVEVQVDGCGPGCACAPPLPSEDPAVVKFFHDLDRRLQASAYPLSGA